VPDLGAVAAVGEDRNKVSVFRTENAGMQLGGISNAAQQRKAQCKLRLSLYPVIGYWLLVIGCWLKYLT